MNTQRKEPAGDQINSEGARRYAEGAKANARSGASDAQAHEAAKALDGPEGKELRRAEQVGKAAAKRRS